MKRTMPGPDEGFDVVVVGGGPGGSAAAKRCAREGFKTLLLEKRRLPRDKVCTGMIMGPWAHDAIQREFGDIPQGVLVSPQGLAGHMIHVPGAPPRVLEWRTPLTRRKDLDFWMNQRAMDEGVEILDGVRVTGVSQTDDECFVAFRQEGKGPRVLRSRFVIGADGAASVVRKSLFPSLRVRYSAPVRHCYEGALDVDKEYIHWFFPKSRPRPRFDLVHKGDSFLLEGSGIRELRNEMGRILAPHGFEPGSRPLWKDGCVEPLLHADLISGAFVPAAGNIMLAGDAAGLIFPVTFEGIGAALKSGLAAADSISQAEMNGGDPAGIYLRALTPLLGVLRRLHSLQEHLYHEAARGARILSQALAAAYSATLHVDL